MQQVSIVDSGGANIASLKFALERLGAVAHVTSDPARLMSATHVILPGVGSAAHAMQRLHGAHLPAVLRALTCPVLGICLGMQLLFESSEEGSTACLGIIDGRIRRLEPAAGRPVPHMGWNQLAALRDDPLLQGVGSGEHVYFVHSYAASVTDATLAICDYGPPLTAVARSANFWGTQFHPERSSHTGARILNNFLRVQ